MHDSQSILRNEKYYLTTDKANQTCFQVSRKCLHTNVQK